jgi:hypothetical protein
MGSGGDGQWGHADTRCELIFVEASDARKGQTSRKTARPQQGDAAIRRLDLAARVSQLEVAVIVPAGVGQGTRLDGACGIVFVAGAMMLVASVHLGAAQMRSFARGTRSGSSATPSTRLSRRPLTFRKGWARGNVTVQRSPAVRQGLGT